MSSPDAPKDPWVAVILFRDGSSREVRHSGWEWCGGYRAISFSTHTGPLLVAFDAVQTIERRLAADDD